MMNQDYLKYMQEQKAKAKELVIQYSDIPLQFTHYYKNSLTYEAKGLNGEDFVVQLGGYRTDVRAKETIGKLWAEHEEHFYIGINGLTGEMYGC